jgi:hypothetical protein
MSVLMMYTNIQVSFNLCGSPFTFEQLLYCCVNVNALVFHHILNCSLFNMNIVMAG